MNILVPKGSTACLSVPELTDVIFDIAHAAEILEYCGRIIIKQTGYLLFRGRVTVQEANGVLLECWLPKPLDGHERRIVNSRMLVDGVDADFGRVYWYAVEDREITGTEDRPA